MVGARIRPERDDPVALSGGAQIDNVSGRSDGSCHLRGKRPPSIADPTVTFPVSSLGALTHAPAVRRPRSRSYSRHWESATVTTLFVLKRLSPFWRFIVLGRPERNVPRPLLPSCPPAAAAFVCIAVDRPFGRWVCPPGVSDHEFVRLKLALDEQQWPKLGHNRQRQHHLTYVSPLRRAPSLPPSRRGVAVLMPEGAEKEGSPLPRLRHTPN